MKYGYKLIGYLQTRDAYLAGRIHSAAAIGQIMRDPDFRAEAALNDNIRALELAPLEAARAVVLQVWRAQLVAQSGQIPTL